MKKTFALAALILVATAVNAQEVVLGAQGGFGTTWLLNNNVSDQDEELDFITSYGPVFGIEAGYLFKTMTNVKLGVMVEGNYAVVNQDYAGKFEYDSVLYNLKVRDRLSYIQVPVLFHVTGKAMFFEVGPQFSFLSAAEESFSTSPSTLSRPDLDVLRGFNSSVVSVAFGFGAHFNVATNLFVDTRLRFTYGLTDATVDYGSETARNEAANYLSSEYGGIAAHYANTAQKGEYTYKATNLATGHLLVGFTYRIPTYKKEQPVTPR